MAHRAPIAAASGAAGRVLLVLSLGAGLGLAALALEHGPAAAGDLSALGGPWVAAAFAAGALARRPPLGVVAGAAALAAATAVYYAAKAARGSPLNPPEYDTPGFWLAAALVAGAVFGLAGALWASGGRGARVLAAAALAGTIVAELLFWRRPPDSLRLVLVAVALALPLVLLRARGERAAGLALTLAALLAAGVLVDVAAPVVLRLR